MNSERFWTLASRIYDEVHLALWACVAAFAIYFAVFVAPKLPEAHARAESQRILRNAAENRQLCARWGLKAGTPAYEHCLLDLQGFRREIRIEVEKNDDLLF